MLSTQPSNLPGQHRRQNSTPTVLDTLKVPIFPATRPRYGSHRRSQSVDQPTNIQQQQKISSQDDRKVIVKRHEQQHLRETQQHQQQLVRPGQNQQQPRPEPYFDRSLKDIPLNSYPGYSSGTSTHSYFHSKTPEWDDKYQLDLRQTEYLNNIKLDSNIFAGYLDGFEYETLDEAFDDEFKDGTPIESTVAHKNTTDEGISPHASRGRPARPCTPLSQPNNICFPMTPSTSPISKMKRSQRIFETRTASSSPTRKTPNLTIKASQAMKHGSSYQDKFNMSKAAHGFCKLPSPPHSARESYSSSATFPSLGSLDMSAMKMNFSSGGIDYGSLQRSPLLNALPPTISSFQSSPEMNHLPQFCSEINELPESSDQRPRSGLESAKTSHDADLGASKDCAHSSTQSDSEVERDTSVEDTGITSEEIAAFMYGPGPDNRWSCTFPGCTRTFGRKENIKSHIQNHLGDRQFICSVCGNDFVRQHDLKRHMKIHSGVKPYNCPCGRTFCRQDALTRHRQRNTCEGGFSGILKSPIKRGRPKKVRPDSDQRLAKSAKTRQRALEKAYEKVYQSSSGSSVCSFSSPPYMPDEIIICGASPLDDVESLRANLTEFLSSTPPTSPSHSTGNSFSSQNSKLSSAAIRVSVSPSPKIASIQEESQDMLLTHAMSRETSTSYYGTPPELDLSCSSPLAPNFLDFDSESTTVTGAAPIVTLPETKASSSDLDMSTSNRELDQMFMDSISSSSLDKDPLFTLENFEDPFTSSSSWQDGFDENPDNFFDTL